ncbi:MAG: hypothetical protein K0U86_03420 [Planctomycetes bacterium]|nr:hypothetical protein [Planctomycetota bacterium]MCH9723936.1 hypothetical protein [Planctomycetota bacterium]MCH9778662.1 hypothetical protein [Planctomycetota bacterium]MCH9791249.1 hypothetical protein [Planctomycetota bacterium]MDF1746706.1 hypothetical protein [Gimesia sp.]
MKTSQLSSLSVLMICLIFVLGNHTWAQEKKEETTTLPEQQKKVKALEHAKKGQELLKRKYWKKAASEFEKAIAFQPESSVLHYLLGVSYLENSQASKGWVEFRKAVLLDSTNKRAANDFMKIWDFFDRKGLLNVGTPEVEVLKVLGKPDRERNQKSKSQLSYGFMWVNFRQGRLFALVDTRGLTAELTRALNTMEFQLPPRWREGYRNMNANSALTEYVTEEDTVQNYQQLFTTQRLLKQGEKGSAKAMMNHMKSLLEKSHQIEVWNVIQEGDNDILYEWRVAKNEQAPAQHEIARLIKGKRDMHRLAYTNRKLPLSEETRTQWIKLIQSAKLILAHPEKMKLSAPQKKELADQLTKKSREIIKLQLQYIQNLDVKSMKPYFTERVRNLITSDLLKSARKQAETASPEELVHSIQLEDSGDQIQAKIKMKNGRTLTTLILVKGKWEADTIWFK